MTTTTAKPPAPTAPANPDALPTAGGSYTRQPDGTLVPNPPAAAADALATDTPATPE